MCLSLNACGWSGTRIEKDFVESIQVGVISQQDIMEIFGEPQNKTNWSDGEVLVYVYVLPT